MLISAYVSYNHCVAYSKYLRIRQAHSARNYAQKWDKLDQYLFTLYTYIYATLETTSTDISMSLVKKKKNVQNKIKNFSLKCILNSWF